MRSQPPRVRSRRRALVRPGILLGLLVLMVPAAGPALAAAPDPTAIERGSAIYRGGTCPVCHHWEGQGNRRGPDLTDDEWLHGDGSPTTVRKAIETGFRHGAGRRFRGKYEMWPLGGMALDEGDVEALTAYVWSLHRRRRAADTLTREIVSRIAFGAGSRSSSVSRPTSACSSPAFPWSWSSRDGRAGRTCRSNGSDCST